MIRRFLSGLRGWRRLVAAADRARDRSDWIEAANLYSRALKIDSDRRPAIWLQYGHALKESGQLERAEKAYVRATELRPNDADAFVQIGHVQKMQGRSDLAVGAYAQALRINPDLTSARTELLHLGARDALPEHGPAGLRRAQEMLALSTGFARMRTAMDRWSMDAPQPPDSYDAFRARYPIPPPPELPVGAVTVHILAHDAIPAMVRATILSLRDQDFPHWSATVISEDLHDHTVGSAAYFDDRISFASKPPTTGDTPVLWLAAGTLLDRQCLNWLAFAIKRTGAAAVYADHDAILPDWRDGPVRYAPRLYPLYDPIFIAATDEPPIALLVSSAIEPPLPKHDRSAELLRGLLLAIGGTHPIAHVPRVLFSRQSSPVSIVEEGPRDSLEADAKASMRPALPASRPGRIAVIIATRDLAAMLEACVESLIEKAERPDLLDFLILDNRSVEPATHELLRRWQRQGKATVIPFDEPFNWSRANNRGAAATRAEILCLVNNDTVCRSAAWDTCLTELLAQDEIGAVGARLLYPDETVQHAGVVFGTGRGSPVHEGVGAPKDDGGPLDRWRTRRSVPAVTGAFLGLRRTLFEKVGGLDETNLPVGFNDIDLCLKIRAPGLRIVYEPALELLHHESKTRGMNDTFAKLEWDHGELQSFRERWGEAMFLDPGYNPGWARSGRPFEGFIEPSMRLVLDHIDRSAGANPWAVME